MQDKLKDLNFSSEIKDSFLNYAMSVIVSRALPDVRDGFKPVHRRIIYSMQELGLSPDKSYRKCARIVGDVLGKYHPHGDTAVYDALVRLAQEFSMRYMLVDGHGNFGSIDGDGAAAMRYTEAKMAKIAAEMVRDINKNTVDFIDNFDGEEKEPEVLPSRIPNLLVNGATGIAVGMATNIPPHNLGEIIDGIIALIDNPDLETLDLMNFIKGPDFPTGASILGNSGIRNAYETGRGSITIRSKVMIDELPNGKPQITVTEIPYQVNKANLITKIADLVRDKIIDGITDLRDESNRDGIKIVIELRRDANANVVLNNLYKHTSLQTSYGINNLALVDGQPRVLSLKEMLIKYTEHQKNVIIRRTKFDLEKAKNRAHILEGLKIALDNIDGIVKLLKQAENDNIATIQLIEKFNLSEIQAKAILEMKLRRLTGLERDKIEDELRELAILIDDLIDILSKDSRIMEIVINELTEVKDKFGDERRTIIDMSAIDYIEDESLIPVEDIIITLTNKGYIKRLPVDTYRTQNRGGVGVKGITTNEADFVEKLLSMKTHDFILFFSNRGKVYRMKGYEIPEFSRQSKGLPIINLLPLEKDESIRSIVTIEAGENPHLYLSFVTKKGLIKRTSLEEFDSIRNGGKIAIVLKEEDELISVRKTSGENEIIIASSNGRLVRFKEDCVRVMGRSTSGVKGIELGDGIVIGAEIINPEEQVLIVTENGYGKKTPIEEYRLTNRGSKGVKALNITEKNGNLVSLQSVSGDDDLMIITDSGIIIRIPIDQVSQLKRATQGVRLINLKDDQKVATVAKILKEEIDQEDIMLETNASEENIDNVSRETLE